MVSKGMGAESVLKLTVSLSHFVDVAAPLPSDTNLTNPKTNQPAPMQNATYWHRYLTASLWNLYTSSAHLDEKVHHTTVHMQKLGLKQPAEKTLAYVAGLIHFVTDGFQYDQTTALLTSKPLREMLKLRWAHAPLGPEPREPGGYRAGGS